MVLTGTFVLVLSSFNHFLFPWKKVCVQCHFFPSIKGMVIDQMLSCSQCLTISLIMALWEQRHTSLLNCTPLERTSSRMHMFLFSWRLSIQHFFSQYKINQTLIWSQMVLFEMILIFAYWYDCRCIDDLL